jgi:hypothetical protein
MNTKRHRPIAITILTLLMVASTIYGMFRVLPTAHLVRPWFPALFAVSIVVTLACGGGMWMMQQWSVYLYAVWNFGMMLVEVCIGIFVIYALVVRLAIIAIGFYYICWRSMGKPNEPLQPTATR